MSEQANKPSYEELEREIEMYKRSFTELCASNNESYNLVLENVSRLNDKIRVKDKTISALEAKLKSMEEEIEIFKTALTAMYEVGKEYHNNYTFFDKVGKVIETAKEKALSLTPKE